jgi:hypothetical protein
MVPKKASVGAPVKKDLWVISMNIKMDNTNRDLLVLFKQEFMTPQAMEQEVEMLHGLLHSVEKPENIAAVSELIDLNKYRIISKQKTILSALLKSELKPFVFLNCKN